MGVRLLILAEYFLLVSLGAAFSSAVGSFLREWTTRQSDFFRKLVPLSGSH